MKHSALFRSMSLTPSVPKSFASQLHIIFCPQMLWLPYTLHHLNQIQKFRIKVGSYVLKNTDPVQPQFVTLFGQNPGFSFQQLDITYFFYIDGYNQQEVDAVSTANCEEYVFQNSQKKKKN
jgi:hypothetical protein